VSALLFARAGWSNATGHRLSLWRVGTVAKSRILVSRCSGIALLHVLARDGVLIDARSCAPADDSTMNDPTDRAAVKVFREQIRRALKEIAPIAPALAAEMRRCFRLFSNLALMQFDARSPEIVTRENHDLPDFASQFDKVTA